MSLKVRWHIKSIEYNHFICHYYCPFLYFSYNPNLLDMTFQKKSDDLFCSCL